MNEKISTLGEKKQSVISSILWLTIAEILFNFSGYIIHAVLGRMLGPSDYGRYALVVTLTTMIIMLIGNGIPTAMSKYISALFETNPATIPMIKRYAARLQLALIGFITIIFFFISPIVAKLLHDPSLTSLLRISSFIIPSFAAASFYLYYYIGLHRFSLQSTLKIVRSFARVAFVIGLAYFFGLKGSVAAYILAPATVFVTAWFIDRFSIDRQFPKNESTFFDWKKLLDYAWPVTLFMLFYEVLISLDLYFVKALLQDDSQTGIYNAALTVGRIPYYLFYALTMVMLPSLSRTTSQGNNEEARKIIAQTFRMMVMILIPALVIMVVYADPLVQFFFGRKFSSAAIPMQILTPGMIFLTVFYVMSSALNGAGKVKIPMYVSLFGMILNAILNYVLVLKFGIAGSALATTITAVLITIILSIYVRRFFQTLMGMSPFLKFLLAGVIMFLSSFLFPPDRWWFLIWSIPLAGVYLGTLVFFREFTKSDIALFQKMMFPKIKKMPSAAETTE